MPRRRITPKTLLQLVVLASLVVIGTNYQYLEDGYALATFHPSADVAAIQSRLGLTRAAKAQFYRSQPRIDSKAAFNTDCETVKGELELGCFYRDRIYILQIDNASLSPEMDVVTAHELLHAAWTRLSSGERAKLGAQLEAAFTSLHDADLTARMMDYSKSEPGQQDNELHSILGTEYAGLSPELEAHYRLFFSNRASILASHASYKGVFDSRRQALATELAAIRSLKGQLATLNRQLQQYRWAGDISTYNALVPRQNSLVDDINNRIDTYQKGVDEYNALSKSLDSQLITDTETSIGK